MFDIVIIAVGKMKDKNYAAAAGEYIKRLAPFAKIRIEELRAEPFRSESAKEQAKAEEGARILAALKKYPDAEIHILDERGKELRTQELAEAMRKQQNRKLVFVVGGTAGLADDILNSQFAKLAVSKFTLPHELARVVLFEQIYRCVCINNGKQYHY